jgi:energy-coupling factor transporter ATP-binding protein EcfA2
VASRPSARDAVSCRGVAKVWAAGTERAHAALRDIDLDVAPGEFTVLIGPSGCGKSTLLYLVPGLGPATTVEIRSFADSVIAFYDAKYTYNRWRPVTAIREAGTDDNPDTTPDASWLPVVGNTTPDPAYPGAHAVISAAAAEVLVAVLHGDHLPVTVTSEVLPGVERSFASLSAIAEEATQSRIFAGVHFRSDLTSGHRLGRDVADFVLDHFLTLRHGQDEDEVR